MVPIHFCLELPDPGNVHGSSTAFECARIRSNVRMAGHLQTTVTQETSDWYGGSAGQNASITVTSPGSNDVVVCPNGGNSSTLLLEVD